jgi:hypothetical protein
MAEPIATPEEVGVPVEKKKSKLVPLIIVGAVLVWAVAVFWPGIT